VSALSPAPIPSPRASGPALREILYPTDLLPESSAAFDHVRTLAERFRACVTLYHAAARPDLEFTRGVEEQWSGAAEAARRQLVEAARRLPGEPAICVEKVVSPARALIAWIRARRPDLVVMATHGPGGLSHLLLGSVTEQVIQHARRPVLCVRLAPGDSLLPYRRLLVPTDLSPASRAAFGHAAALARAFGAQVVALYVAPAGADPRAVSEAAVRSLLRDHFPETEVVARVDQGRAWERIVHQARAERADLVVMACQGADEVGERLLGSNAERVVRHAPCPVLVV